MEKNIIKKSKNIYMSGIGGTGMSGLAMLLINSRKKIYGSDKNSSDVILKLTEKGAVIYKRHESKNVTSNIDVFIYSHAILPDNPEYKKAIECHIPMLSYPEAVGLIMKEKKSIAVAGTHGKTTTSSLVVSILKNSSYSPSFLLGGEILNTGNSGVGDSDLLVVEACEYKRGFLNYQPYIGIVTNVEKDHLDYYKDLNEIKGAFKKFLLNVRKDGKIIYCADDKNTLNVTEEISGTEKISYGISSGDWRAKNIKFCKNFTHYDCYFKNTRRGVIKSRTYGYHNILNSLAAISCSDALNVPFTSIQKGLENFQGVHRRCEILGVFNGITIIDDYGHHPTEISFTLRSIRELYPNSRLIVVFQPHQYSRTRILLKDFAASFALANKIVVPDIYFVRDSLIEKKLVNAQMLAEKIRENGREALYLPTFNEIIAYLTEILVEGDILLTIGAGPIDKVARGLMEKLSG